MNKDNLTYTTAGGSTINLEFPAKFHTIMPALSSLNMTSLIKDDMRFEHLETFYKKINGYNIEYCKVKITDKVKYDEEKEYHEKYKNKICYLTVVSSNDEPLYKGDLEPSYLNRAVFLPEKL
tara:strand:+ start:199 stop:564 length:366 start_codon:yes stop_codon:yes gene_type:complete